MIYHVLLVLITIKVAIGNPLIYSPSFEDEWDFRLLPDQEPLVKIQKEHLEQLTATKREGKKTSVEDDLSFIETQRSAITPLQDGVIKETIPCSICNLGVGIIQGDVKKGKSYKSIKDKFVSLCTAFQIQTHDVCSGFFDVYAQHVLPTFNYTTLGPEEICYMVLGESCKEIENVSHEWYIKLPNNPKPIIESLPELHIGKQSLKVLQISDTHFDPDYAEGSPASCKEPLCCRSYSTPESKSNVKPAGKWGSYTKCDSPLILIENMFENIALDHPDLDYIIWTGDLPPHDIWNQTKNTILKNLEVHVKLFQKHFPSVPVFPVLGNHEGVPAGSFPPPWVFNNNYSINWLYEKAEEQWQKWLPNTSSATIQQGGFYSILIRPSFRIISLNTNYCGTLNWWLLLNSTDPSKELKWLVHELQTAEDKGEKVHIIGHIAPGASDCLKEWSRNYNRIINRYESTVTGQFFGHSHGDEFEVFYNDETATIPTNVAYLCPSVTTFGNHNPAYRIYYVDGEHDTWEIIDHETWTTDLEDANAAGKSPVWYKLYSARDAYNMTSLRPNEWDKLIKRMINDPVTFGKYYKYYYRDSKARPFCNSSCKIQTLCDLKSSRSQHRRVLCSNLVDNANI